MNTNVMLHRKTILFLISLPEHIIQEVENKGVDYAQFLESIKSFPHVEMHQTISEELIKKSSPFQIVVIVGHNQNGNIELADGSLFPLQRVVSLLPITFSGYIHVAVCGSSLINASIKEQCPNAKVRTADEFTQLERNLLIYSHLLSRSDLNKDNFSLWFTRLEELIKEAQARKDPVELEQLPSATKLGTMATGERPFEVLRNSEFFIKVIFHEESTEETIVRNIKNAYNIPYRFKDSLLEQLKDDEIIYVSLHFNCYYPELTKYIIGGGEHEPIPIKKIYAKTEASFRCFVEDGFRLNAFSGTVTIKIKDNLVDSWEFQIRVIPYIDEYKTASSSNELNDEYSDNRRQNRLSFGPRVNYGGTPPINRLSVNKSETEKEKLTDELLAQAIKAVQKYMWGQSAYAVLFCECRDHWGYPNNKAQFERLIDDIAKKFNLKLDYVCPFGTISDAFRHNDFYASNVRNWKNKEPFASTRANKLLEVFQKALSDLM